MGILNTPPFQRLLPPTIMIFEYCPTMQTEIIPISFQGLKGKLYTLI